MVVIKFLSPACADFFSTKYVIQPKLGSKCAYWVCMLTIGRGIYMNTIYTAKTHLNLSFKKWYRKQHIAGKCRK